MPQIQNLFELNQFKSLVKKIPLKLLSLQNAFFLLETLKRVLHNQDVDVRFFSLKM